MVKISQTKPNGWQNESTAVAFSSPMGVFFFFVANARVLAPQNVLIRATGAVNAAAAADAAVRLRYCCCSLCCSLFI